MQNIGMYELNLENVGDLKLISQMKYAESLGLSNVYLNKIFNNNSRLKLSTAKCIISLAYDISVRDSEQMQELLDKHFTRVK